MNSGPDRGRPSLAFALLFLFLCLIACWRCGVGLMASSRVTRTTPWRQLLKSRGELPYLPVVLMGDSLQRT